MPQMALGHTRTTFMLVSGIATAQCCPNYVREIKGLRAGDEKLLSTVWHPHRTRLKQSDTSDRATDRRKGSQLLESLLQTRRG